MDIIISCKRTRDITYNPGACWTKALFIQLNVYNTQLRKFVYLSGTTLVRLIPGLN